MYGLPKESKKVQERRDCQLRQSFSIHTIKNDIPTFVVDAPGGGGKIALQPNYVLSQSPDKVILRNFEGVITSYPEPEHYIPNQADAYFTSVYPEVSEQKEPIGLSAIFADKEVSFTPENVSRIKRREAYTANPEHETLKNRRDKRDELKEKKFLAQQKKEKEGAESGGDSS
ncbi:hypothetical protein P9684_03825 [Bacillus atrophaeus]|nr:hypothetical protein [Bacillus atrophaeus]